MLDLKIRWALFADESEVTTRHRGIYVYDALRVLGWDAGPWDRCEQADIIICQYSFKDLPAATTHAKVVVCDINDLVFLEGHPSAAGFTNNIRRAHAVVAGTEYLAERLQQKHPFVRQIHDVVHPMYGEIERVEHDGLNLLFVGMNMNARYFSEIDDVLEALAKKYEFTVNFVIPASDGAGGHNHSNIAKKKYPAKWIEWSLPELKVQMSVADVGVVPLVHTAWTSAKSPNKIAQFMAAGIPTIAADVPVYRQVITSGKNGFLCTHPEDWFAAGEKLLTDAALRRKMGDAGRDARLAFSPEVIAGQWAQLFEEIRPR